jgi:hypothetical protein
MKTFNIKILETVNSVILTVIWRIVIARNEAIHKNTALVSGLLRSSQ